MKKTKEHREKLSQSMRGRKLSEYHKEKLSEAMKGRVNYYALEEMLEKAEKVGRKRMKEFRVDERNGVFKIVVLATKGGWMHIPVNEDVEGYEAVMERLEELITGKHVDVIEVFSVDKEELMVEVGQEFPEEEYGYRIGTSSAIAADWYEKYYDLKEKEKKENERVL